MLSYLVDHVLGAILIAGTTDWVLLVEEIGWLVLEPLNLFWGA